MGVFGVDVSNHNPNFKDFRGWDFAFIKSSEGNTFRDWVFNQHLTNARAAGCLVAAYHYQRDVSAQSQVDLIKNMVPRDVPVIIDVETGSGSLSITREIIRLLREEGYDSPLLYLPRWHWRDVLGSPSLVGLPLLWASWYPDYVARPREEGINYVPQSAWADYGGVRVAMMQFTSTPHDMNFYPGTRDELARLLNGGTSGGSGENDMQANEPVQWYDGTNTDFVTTLKYLQSAVQDLYTKFNSPVLDSAANSYKMSGFDLLRLVDFNGLKLDTLLARTVADVDEDALAEALASRGVGGASPAQVKAALTEVLSNTKLTPGS